MYNFHASKSAILSYSMYSISRSVTVGVVVCFCASISQFIVSFRSIFFAAFLNGIKSFRYFKDFALSISGILVIV